MRNQLDAGRELLVLSGDFQELSADVVERGMLRLRAQAIGLNSVPLTPRSHAA